MSQVIEKTIPGFDRYTVNNIGEIFSINHRNTGIKKKMIPAKSLNGYLNVGLYKNGKRHAFGAHVLVAKVFIPNPDSKKEVNHINGNKEDNRVENLEWSSRRENLLHANAMHGTNMEKARGVSNIIKGYRIKYRPSGKIFNSIREAERSTGISRYNISKELPLGVLWEKTDTSSSEKIPKNIIHIETGNKYSTISQASKSSKVPYSTIWMHLNRDIKKPLWKYLVKKTS